MSLSYTVDRMPERFDEFTASQPGVSCQQTRSWGTFKSTAYETHSLLFLDGDAVFASAIVLFKHVPGIGRTLAMVHYGPIFADAQPEHLAFVARSLQEYCRQHKAFYLRVHPQVQRDEAGGIEHAFLDAGYVLNEPSRAIHSTTQPRFQMMVDIDRPLDEVVKSFSKDTRTKVRKGEKKGLVAEFTHGENIEIFYRLMLETEARDGFVTGKSLDDLRAMFETHVPGCEISLCLIYITVGTLRDLKTQELKTIDAQANKFERQLADDSISPEKAANVRRELETLSRRRGRADAQLDELAGRDRDERIYLSGGILLTGTKEAMYLHGASSDAYRELYPNYMMQLEMIRYAQEQGCTTYNFGGVSGYLDAPDRPEDEPAGLYEFKKQFGTYVFETLGEFDYIYSPVLYHAWHFVGTHLRGVLHI